MKKIKKKKYKKNKILKYIKKRLNMKIKKKNIKQEKIINFLFHIKII